MPISSKSLERRIRPTIKNKGSLNGLLPLAAVWILSTYSCAPDSVAATGKQPIKYNHKIHVQDNEMECTECHKYAESYARATIPNIEVCGECHADEPMTDSVEEQKLLVYVNEGRKIPWIKVHRVASHVYFSHRRHTTLGQIGCDVCHGNAGEMTEPFTKPVVPVSMGRCINCHESRGVDNDCTRCHR